MTTNIKTFPIRTAVFKHLDTTVSGVGIDFNEPFKLDTEDESVTKWCEVEVTDVNTKASRAACSEGDIQIVVDVFSRSQTQLHDADITLDVISEALKPRTRLEIIDHTVSDEPTLGFLSLGTVSVQHNSLGQHQHVTGVFQATYQDA